LQATKSELELRLQLARSRTSAVDAWAAGDLRENACCFWRAQVPVVVDVEDLGLKVKQTLLYG
jgi:hypothetical protein